MAIPVKVTKHIATEPLTCDGYELLKIYATVDVWSNDIALCLAQCMLYGYHNIKPGKEYFIYESQDGIFICSVFVHRFAVRLRIFQNDFEYT